MQATWFSYYGKILQSHQNFLNRLVLASCFTFGWHDILKGGRNFPNTPSGKRVRQQNPGSLRSKGFVCVKGSPASYHTGRCLTSEDSLEFFQSRASVDLNEQDKQRSWGLFASALGGSRRNHLVAMPSGHPIHPMLVALPHWLLDIRAGLRHYPLRRPGCRLGDGRPGNRW
jgi:hypothetical protein